MSKAVAPRLLTARVDDPAYIWSWYQFQRQVLGEEATRAEAAVGSAVGATNLALNRYLGKTPEELTELFAEQKRELDLLTMLGLLAATEGALQRDFAARVDQRLKDGVSREFQKASKRRRNRNERISLEQDILAIWREHGPQPKAKNTVNLFKSVLDLRHWLAHGRHWTAQLGRDYDAQDVRVLCDNLLNAIGI